MDDLVKTTNLFRGKRVLLTGDTGFKGTWLALWLSNMGADVYGYALPPEQSNAHFNQLNLREKIHHQDGDIRDAEQLRRFFNLAKPEFVFHLAAQALVRRSYYDPKATFDVNIGGSVNLLECVRHAQETKVLVYITSDKCYQNKEWTWGYRENDELGGPDPYSASKAAAELVFSAYGKSFFENRVSPLGYASVRAGNVIGGGDWSDDRIVPDCIRSLQQGKSIILRKPSSTRPWQHVFEPLSGYLSLAAALHRDPYQYTGAWNFGPKGQESRSVLEMTKAIIHHWGSPHTIIQQEENDFHEAGLLQLNCDKANQLLGWWPRWSFERTIAETVDWYRTVLAGMSVMEISSAQIQRYMESHCD